MEKEKVNVRTWLKCNDYKAAALPPDCCSQSQVGGERKQQPKCVCEFMCVYELTINKKDQCECVCSYSSGYDGEKLQDIGFGLNNETDYKILK